MPAYSRKIETLAEAIIKYSGYQEPTNCLYAARNPGGLKATSLGHAKDANGNRVFLSLMDGLQALLYDIHLKIHGKSWAKLKSTDTLIDLASAYGKPTAATTAQAWSRFLRAALNDQTISAKTQLSYFIEETNDSTNSTN